MVERAHNGKEGEGVWRMRVTGHGYLVDVRLGLVGSTKGEPWNAACADPVLKRRVGGAGATYGHTLADVEDAIVAWHAGQMPRMSVAGDSRTPEPEIDLVPLVEVA